MYVMYMYRVSVAYPLLASQVWQAIPSVILDMLCIQLLILVHSTVWEPSTKKRSATNLYLSQNTMYCSTQMFAGCLMQRTAHVWNSKTKFFVLFVSRFVSRLHVCNDFHLCLISWAVADCCPQHLEATCLSLWEAGLGSLVVLDARGVIHRSFYLGLGYKPMPKRFSFHFTHIISRIPETFPNKLGTFHDFSYFPGKTLDFFLPLQGACARVTKSGRFTRRQESRANSTRTSSWAGNAAVIDTSCTR